MNLGVDDSFPCIPPPLHYLLLLCFYSKANAALFCWKSKATYIHEVGEFLTISTRKSGQNKSKCKTYTFKITEDKIYKIHRDTCSYLYFINIIIICKKRQDFFPKYSNTIEIPFDYFESELVIFTCFFHFIYILQTVN